MSQFGLARIVAPFALAVLGAAPALAAQHPTPYAVSHPRRPTPSKVLIDRGLSLEHECLNAVQATRTAARNAAPSDTAATHLERAETAAHAGRGQLCQDELASAAESLR